MTDQDEQGSKPKQTRVKRRNPLVQLQQSIDDLAEMAKDSSLKPNNRADLQLRRADAILSLAKLSVDKAESEASAESAALKQEIATANTRIAELESECSHFKQKASERLVETVPDPEAAQIRRALLDKDDLIKNTAQAIRENVEEPIRLRVAAALCKRSGRGAQPVISELGVDFSIYQASQRSTEDLENVITQAAPGARGSNIQISKAVLAARGVPIPEVGSFSTRPVYRDVFDAIDSGEF